MLVLVYTDGREKHDKDSKRWKSSDQNTKQSSGLMNALPVAVGAASVGAMLGLEMRKQNHQDIRGHRDIISEIYAEDHDDDEWHMDAE